MPKRQNEDMIRYYKSKIKKLRKEKKPVRRRCIVYSDSSSDENADNDNVVMEVPLQDDLAVESPPEPNIDLLPQEADPEIDADFLSALGDTADEAPMYGEKIHETLAQRWLPILRRGISKEDKEKLLKSQKIPENCKLLRAPILNPEISAALVESTRSRDKKIENSQQQLGLGITAVNRAMHILVMGSEDKQTKIQAIKILSDACRILADLHHMNTKSRINLITPTLDKSFLTIIQDVERDESIFGSKLSEKIKASKAIEKQGLQIKKSVAPQKAATPSTSHSTNRTRFQGNWTAPSRFQSPSNRGGRGSAQKTPFVTHKSSNSTSGPAKTTHHKQRAPPRH